MVYNQCAVQTVQADTASGSYGEGVPTGKGDVLAGGDEGGGGVEGDDYEGVGTGTGGRLREGYAQLIPGHHFNPSYI
ncbi:hypothetical protein CVT25_000321 [Psilocybe cyanescens]|uniref:Uncharacterized protein n=1 Tax=Psilocybe cyanescens TaxID=93625 RepID=A0A409XEV3_PSICY|nr:hypothetical protein CVT25_000321 [Psilocybe cyanescens]